MPAWSSQGIRCTEKFEEFGNSRENYVHVFGATGDDDDDETRRSSSGNLIGTPSCPIVRRGKKKSPSSQTNRPGGRKEGSRGREKERKEGPRERGRSDLGGRHSSSKIREDILLRGATIIGTTRRRVSRPSSSVRPRLAAPPPRPALTRTP